MPDPIRLDLGRAQRLAEAIIALLRKRGDLGSCYIGPNRSDERGAAFTVYWEGTDASAYFSLEHCCPGGGPTSAYERHTAMMELCSEHDAHFENSWAASPVYLGED